MGLVFSMFKTLLKVFLSLFKSFDWLFYILLIFIVALIIDFIFVKVKYFKGCKREKIAHINFDGKVSIFEQIFILLPRQFWKNYYNKNIGEFNEHGIIMFTGKQGQGKTLAETKYLIDMQYNIQALRLSQIMVISKKMNKLTIGINSLIIIMANLALFVLLMNAKTGLVPLCLKTFHLVCWLR